MPGLSVVQPALTDAGKEIVTAGDQLTAVGELTAGDYRILPALEYGNH